MKDNIRVNALRSIPDGYQTPKALGASFLSRIPQTTPLSLVDAGSHPPLEQMHEMCISDVAGGSLLPPLPPLLVKARHGDALSVEIRQGTLLAHFGERGR